MHLGEADQVDDDRSASLAGQESVDARRDESVREEANTAYQLRLRRARVYYAKVPLCC